MIKKVTKDGKELTIETIKEKDQFKAIVQGVWAHHPAGMKVPGMFKDEESASLNAENYIMTNDLPDEIPPVSD